MIAKANPQRTYPSGLTRWAAEELVHSRKGEVSDEALHQEGLTFVTKLELLSVLLRKCERIAPGETNELVTSASVDGERLTCSFF